MMLLGTLNKSFLRLYCRTSQALSSYVRRTFAVAGQTVWNSLSDDLRDPTLSTDSFRRLIKTRLFSEYWFVVEVLLS